MKEQSSWRARRFIRLGVCFVFLFFCTHIWVVSLVSADTSSTAVTVNISVPGTGGTPPPSPPGPPPGPPQPPPPPPPPPGGGLAISSVVVSPNGVSADASWRATTGDSVAIVRCDADIGRTAPTYTATIAGADLGGGNYQGSFTGLQPNTDYAYRIRCIDVQQRGGVFEDSFRTVGRDDVPPNIVNVSTAPAVTGAITTWTATDDVRVLSCTYDYNVNDPAGPYPNRGLVTTLANNQYRTSLASLAPNTQYFFRIVCVDGMPNGVIAFGQFRTNASQTPPPDVQNPAAVPGSQEVLVRWEFPQTFPDLASFVIRRGVGTRPATMQDGELAATLTDGALRQYRDAGRTNGTGYFYTIFVVNTSGLNSNGVSVSATPTGVAQDRDGDGVDDTRDLCDANTPSQADTPQGTVVAVNGCPRVTIDMTDLTIRPRYFQHVSVGQEPTIPIILTDTTVITAGLQGGLWVVEIPGDNVQFTVAPAGTITWPTALNNTFSVSYNAQGARLIMQGYRFTVDSRDLDPRSTYRIYSVGGATGWLPENADVRLYPRSYSSMDNLIAPFRVTQNGAIAWDAPYNEIYEYTVQNRTLRVHGVPICIRQDTLQGGYTFTTLQGNTPFISGDATYRILPSFSDVGQSFSPMNPYLIAQARVNESRNVNLFMGPKRLQDPTDGESGAAVNITLNVQNVRVNLDSCAAPPGCACGDGVLCLSEQCDNGARNGEEGNACSRFCTLRGGSVCGNGTLELGEECDDGNRTDRDGCSGLCRREVVACGNAFVEGTEECDDGNTRDGDSCSTLCRRETAPAACNDRRDNDGDALIDLQDPGCENAADTNEYDVPRRIPRRDPTVLLFWIAARTIQTEPIDGVVASLPDDQLTVGFPASLLSPGADRVEMVFRDTRYILQRSSSTDMYTADIVVPTPGRYEGLVEERGPSEIVTAMAFVVASVPRGVVTVSAGGAAIAGATVALYDAGETLWAAQNYRQGNPIMTDAGGAYGFLVLAGRYRLRIERPGYHTLSGLPFNVPNRVVNQSFALVAVGPPIRETLNRAIAAPSLETGVELIRAIGGKAAEYASLATVLKNDPGIQELNTFVVAPTALGVSLAIILPSLWSTLLPLLRYLFLQPLLLFGKRRRRGWGQIYNGLSKLPVDLAIVRLISTADNRVLQTRVSDPNGRYIFFVEPGDYRLEVHKDGFVYPSAALAGVKSDGRMVDIYHGERIHATEENATVTPNIPVDPSGGAKTPVRLMVEKYVRAAQHIMAVAGIGTTAVSLYVSPSGVMGVFLAIHVATYALFVRYLLPKKPKGWGIVYDARNRKPIGLAVVRLFTKEYDRLVESQITDRKGRYAFLIGPNDYYVTFEKVSYEKHRSPDFLMKTQPIEEVFITDDALLKRMSAASVPPAPPQVQPPAPLPPPAPPTVPPPAASPPSLP